MKNPSSPFRQRDPEEIQAKKAVQKIQKWIEKNYPRLANSTKTRMIVECLIELKEERKFLSAHS